jgi:8-oxo-dGTP diphosphatase
MGIHGLIKNNNKYLVVKRFDGDEFDAGCWDLLGGGISKGEKIEDAFKREVLEESGLKITEIEILGAYEIEDNSLQLLALASLTEDVKVKISHEHSEYKWVSEEDLFALSPLGIHIMAAKFLLKNNTQIAKYQELISL